VTDTDPPLGLSSRDRSGMVEVQELASSGAASVPALVALLSDPSWVVRRAVVTALARIGTAAVAPLCDTLRGDRTNEARLAAAVDALVASGGEVEAAVLALGEGAGNPAVVCDVAQILGRRKSRDAIPILARWSEHTDDNVAVAAIEALGRIGGSAAVDPLLSAVRTRNFFRTFPAIAVLGQSGDPRAIPPLVELLGEPHYAAEAASALGRSGQLVVVAPLSRLLVEADDALVRCAARALVEVRARNVERFGDPAAVAAAFRAATAGGDVAPSVTRALEGADAGDTVALATVLGWMRDEAGVSALVALLDAEREVADSASRALQSLGQEAEWALCAAIRTGDSARRARLLPLLSARRSVVGELVECLGDPDAAVRAQACNALGRIGDPSAVASLFELIGDADPRVAQASIAAVQSLGSTDAKVHAIVAARSADPRTRRAALRILSYFGYPEALDVLLEAVTDDNERIRDAAASGLALLDDPRALSALVTAASHPSAATRAATMRSLGHAASTPEIVSALRLGLDDADAWVRYYACQSLGKLQVSASADKIEALLSDVAGQVRVAAVEAIAKLGGSRALAALENASLAQDPDVRRAALTGLGRICRPSAFALLLRAAESEDAATRLAAVSAIAETTSPDAVSALIRIGSDPDERVRAAAFDVLATRPGAQATRWLIDRLAFDAERERALAGLAHPVEGRIEGILSALDTADARVSAWLLEALLRMRRPNGNAVAESALQSENVHARRAAAAALSNVDSAAARDALAHAAKLDPDHEVRRISLRAQFR
jgi:HEAT repeat protein